MSRKYHCSPHPRSRVTEASRAREFHVAASCGPNSAQTSRLGAQGAADPLKIEQIRRRENTLLQRQSIFETQESIFATPDFLVFYRICCSLGSQTTRLSTIGTTACRNMEIPELGKLLRLQIIVVLRGSIFATQIIFSRHPLYFRAANYTLPV